MFWLRSVVGLSVFFGLFLGVVFGAAGRWDIPMFWAYIGVVITMMMLAMIGADRDLMKERSKPGPGGQDFSMRWILIGVMLAHLAVAGVDVGRYHWSDTVPFWLQIVSLALIAAAITFAKWATSTNRFFSSVVRIQRDRGHRVVDTGPYAYIRHPGYAAGITWLLVSGMALGSWASAAVAALGIPFYFRRLFLEERVLLAELEGYREYAQRVRWRLIPQVW
jgi:protein-S-isoprenylcysteine O-methyltransferase Ste14